MNEHGEGLSSSPVESVAKSNHPLDRHRSFLEKFLDSFLQEKNIKWMLVVGAAIIFGSSLMLVTKAWPNWSNGLRFLAILGYTGAIYFAAEIGRKRLGLNATYKVLYSLTLLLLPICFMALHWLSAGTAAQSWDLVQFCGLLLPTIGFLWFASSRILDHVLRGRQSTFLNSYCLLCIAGAIPTMPTVFLAFAFTALCWLVFSVGVLKVNRHTFWLAEEHRLPRVFGFLPIAMLGLQFVVLVATKAISQLPAQWMGFGCVMVAATVLLTARTVADVFRQRTGDLVRPMPWHIVIPLFSGLVLTVLGLALSFSGFSYGGDSTYAVIPTAIVAAVLMWMAARDTRHTGFVWAVMICATIAYQCSPTLFADIVQTLKDSTADAMNRERIPFSLYGVTYLPLLGAFALASRWFSKRGEPEVSNPLKHFVTVVAVSLFCVALSDVASLFFVSLANVAFFLILAILFRDRRYVLPSLAGILIATGVAIPALNNMDYTAIHPIWIPTLLAGLAAVMAATRSPDRIFNMIAISESSLGRARDPNMDEPSKRVSLLQTFDGRDRSLSQLFGFVLAGIVSVHWVGNAIFHFEEPVTDASLLQYAFLMAAFVLYTLRNPRYLSGFCLWVMVAFAAVRWVAGLSIPPTDVLGAASCITAGTSLLGYLWLKVSGQISRTTGFGELRRGLGFDAEKLTLLPVHDLDSGLWMQRTQAIVVPLCDLSLVILSGLTAAFHLPLLLKNPLMIVEQSAEVIGTLRLSTIVAVLWLTTAAAIFRSRIAAIAATIALPLLATAALATFGISLSASSLPLTWAIVAGTLFVVCSHLASPAEHTPVLSSIATVSGGWLHVLLILACVSFDLPLRVAAMVCLGGLMFARRQRLSAPQKGYLAVMANIQVLLFAAAIGGCSGGIVTGLIRSHMAAIPIVFLSLSFSALLFDHLQSRLNKVLFKTWASLLRIGMIVLALLSLTSFPGSGMVAVMVAGFVVAAITEVVRAVRRQREMNVWTACAVIGMTAFYLFEQGIISFGVGISQFALLGISVFGLTLAELANRREDLTIIRRPMHLIGQTLPAVVALMAVVREFSGFGDFRTGFNALALMMAAGIYFQQAMATRNRNFAIMAAVIVNAGLMLLWRALDWTEPEFYLVPVGLSVLAFVELLKSELPKVSHDPLRYIGALTILVSPMLQVLEGSWAHMLSLMVLSVIVILASIGLRIRVLVYAGSAFLLVDLVAMVVHSTIANPTLLWVGGVALGAGVIALAAFCENHREKLLSQIRFVSTELATWN